MYPSVGSAFAEFVVFDVDVVGTPLGNLHQWCAALHLDWPPDVFCLDLLANSLIRSLYPVIWKHTQRLVEDPACSCSRPIMVNKPSPAHLTDFAKRSNIAVCQAAQVLLGLLVLGIRRLMMSHPGLTLCCIRLVCSWYIEVEDCPTFEPILVEDLTHVRILLISRVTLHLAPRVNLIQEPISFVGDL